MICSSEKRFFTSNLLELRDWTPNRRATQKRGYVDGRQWTLILKFYTRASWLTLDALCLMRIEQGRRNFARALIGTPTVGELHIVY